MFVALSPTWNGKTYSIPVLDTSDWVVEDFTLPDLEQIVRTSKPPIKVFGLTYNKFTNGVSEFSYRYDDCLKSDVCALLRTQCMGGRQQDGYGELLLFNRGCKEGCRIQLDSEKQHLNFSSIYRLKDTEGLVVYVITAYTRSDRKIVSTIAINIKADGSFGRSFQSSWSGCGGTYVSGQSDMHYDVQYPVPNGKSGVNWEWTTTSFK